MENMRFYNELKLTPAEAKKEIKGGRLKGFTDINPMHRLKRMTEVFGPVGIGWFYEITGKDIISGYGDEKVAIVDVNVYIKNGDEWSKPIPGTGGSSFTTKEKYGVFTSDECFKMALTDALSVAFKALGMGADVYFERDPDNKYRKENSQETNQENATNSKALHELISFTKAKKIDPIEVTDTIQKMFKKNNSTELDEGQLTAVLIALRERYGSK